MVDYVLADKTHMMVIKTITKEEYNVCRDFFLSYKLYENIQYSYLCAHDALKDFKDYVSYLEATEDGFDIRTVHKRGIYLITNLVLFFRLFVDNTKNYNKRFKTEEGKKYVHELEKNYNMKLLKALRDYAQHFSLPVTDTHIDIDIVKETKTINFTINKYELLKNTQNSKNVQTIKAYTDNEIIFNNLVDKWEDTLEKLFLFIIEDFVKKIPKNMKKIILENFGTYKENGKTYNINSFMIIEENRGPIKEVLVMDEEIIFGLTGVVSHYK